MPHPPAPFIPLFDDQTGPNALPAEWHAAYSAWPLPEPTDQPYTYVNFVMSHDGRVSFNLPGRMGGGDVSRRNPNDRWLMGLLRARADAVLVGASGVAWAGNHVWTPEAVAPEDAADWQALRKAEGRQPTPLQVVVTRSGEMGDVAAPIFSTPGLRVLLATTERGREKAGKLIELAPTLEVYVQGPDLDLAQLLRDLRTEYGVRTLLSEAGPQVYGSLQQASLVNDEFVTLSPILIGNTAAAQRPSLIEGVAFSADNPPQSRLLSVHRADSFLFLHGRYREA